MQAIKKEMTFAEELLIQVRKFPGSTDRELSEMLRGKGTHSSQVNQGVRLLESLNHLVRDQRSEDGFIGNYPIGNNKSNILQPIKPSINRKNT